jgi:hypothetical protein
MGIMASYHVKFFKVLLSSEGHQFKVLQRKIAIRRSKSPQRAEKAAQRRFERAEHVRDWRLHADMIEMEGCAEETARDASDRKRTTRERRAH